MTPEIKQQIAARAEAVLKVIHELASTGGESFRMCIPVEPSDTDLLLGTVCHDVSALLSALDAAEGRERALLARVEAAEGENGRLREALTKTRDSIEQYPFVYTGERFINCRTCKSQWRRNAPKEENHEEGCPSDFFMLARRALGED